MLFEDALIHSVSIGKLVETQDPSTGYINVSWQTQHESKAYIQTLRASERSLADNNQVIVTHRIFLPLKDFSGAPMDLDESLEAVQAVPFDYDTQQDLPRYRFKVVNNPYGHHYEIDAVRIEPGGS